MKSKAVPMESIHCDPANARTHDDRNLRAIADSLSRFGQQKPIVVNAAGMILAGNGTYEAARTLGWKEIHVVATDLAGVEATAYAIADNRTSDLSEFDSGALARLLQELQAEDALDGVGFDDDDIDSILARLDTDMNDGACDEDAIPEPPDAATTRTGDLWLLGNHRLLCGDSGSEADVDRLLDGASIHLINTDPPYNVKVEPRSNNAIAAGLSSFGGAKHHQKLDVARHPSKAKRTTKQLRAKDRPLMNDFVTDEAFDEMLAAWFGNMARVLEPGRGFYIWGGYANLGNYPPVLRAVDLYFSQAIVWDKQHPVLTRKDFLGCFELAFYGWKKGAAHQFFGPANVPDLWHVKKVSPQKMIHLTEKSVELARRALHYSSRSNEHVLDLFGGSGSTLIAAEETKRRAFLMEMDPLYVDVIVDRWQQFTGETATLDGTGQSFTDVRNERCPETEGV